MWELNNNDGNYENMFTITTINEWDFQDPKLEVPTMYKAYAREHPHKIWPYMVQYLHFRILKFPLILWE